MIRCSGSMIYRLDIPIKKEKHYVKYIFEQNSAEL